VQIKAEEFLPIAEAAGALAFVDIEASNLKGDFGTVVVVSIKPYKKKPITFSAGPGRDRKLLLQVRNELHKYQLWVTFYGKMFDIPFLQSRLLVNQLEPLEKRHHIDMYWVIKGRTVLSRRNQAHLLSWLGTPEEKMSVSPGIWANMAVNTPEKLEILRKRCESDVAGLEAMYDRCKHLVAEITR
jgi:DNA polymerase elongation subunit (family B)